MYLRARRRRPGREELDDDRDEGTGRGQAQADAHARPYRHTRAGPCRGRAAGSSYAVLTAYIRASRVLEGPLAAAYTIGARRTRPGQNKTRAQRAGFPSGARPLVAAVTLTGRSVSQGSSSCVRVYVSAKGLPCMRSSEVQKRMYSGVTQQRLPLLSPWQPHPAPPPRPTNRAPRAAAAAAAASAEGKTTETLAESAGERAFRTRPFLPTAHRRREDRLLPRRGEGGGRACGRERRCGMNEWALRVLIARGRARGAWRRGWGAVSPEAAANGGHSRIAVRVRGPHTLPASGAMACASADVAQDGWWDVVGGGPPRGRGAAEAGAAMRVRVMRAAGRA